MSSSQWPPEGSSGANTTLSNLTSPTSVNQSLIPSGSENLGSSSSPWAIAYLSEILDGNYHVEPSENAVSVTTSTTTIDLSTASAQALTLGHSTTLTLTNPQVGGAYIFRIVQGSGSYTVAWPASVLWSYGAAPVITTTNAYTDIVNLYYDGTFYYGSYIQNFAT